MKIINISYRLPVSFRNKDGLIEVKSSSGGLVSALNSLKNDENELEWVGVADFSPSDFQQGIQKYNGDFKLEPVYLNKEINLAYYNGFSNAVLWPLFHYFPSFVEFKPGHFEAYIKANRTIADKVVSIAKDGDIIWIHDYQMLAVSGMIREQMPNARIGFFLHIPFPSYELIRLLPKYCLDILIGSMLEADLIGFHTYDYAIQFLNTIQMLFGVQHKQFTLRIKDRQVKIGVYPISIDFNRFDSAFSDSTVAEERAKIKSLYAGKKLIFSVDRLDYTKGIMYRLKGYEKFLIENPDWKEKIIFLLVAVPSRGAIHRYIERKQMIELLISEINGKYGGLKWTPIVYKYGNLNFKELVSLYTACDIALISPLRDGMNLVAKEFAASRQDEDGVLMLSNMTGASKEMADALLFNPLDENEIAMKIRRALYLEPEEKKIRIQSLRKQIINSDISKWSNAFVSDLVQIGSNKTIPELLEYHNKLSILQAYQAAGKRLILLDYDGTLKQFQSSPELAKPDADLLETLQILGSNPRNQLVIVSGRDRQTLEKWFGKLPVTLIAEHGSFVKKGEWLNTSSDYVIWKKSTQEILEFFTQNCRGSFIEEKTFSLSWHYRNSDNEIGFIQSRELIRVLKEYLNGTNASILDGNKVIEIKPVSVNKGDTVLRYFNPENYQFCIAIGDDKTDEDMFEMLNRYQGVTVKVGSTGSVAKYRLETIQMVKSLLEQMRHG